MSRGLFDSVPVEEMDEAYIRRLRHLRWTAWMFCALVFAAILVIELSSAFQASFIYLFALALTMLFFFLSSDIVSGKIDAYESEKIWRKPKEAEGEAS